MSKLATLFVVVLASLVAVEASAGQPPKCKNDLRDHPISSSNRIGDHDVINKALIDLGFASAPIPTLDPTTWWVKEVDLKVVDPSKSPEAKYVFDTQKLYPRVRFKASDQPPPEGETMEWEIGNGISVADVVYVNIKAIVNSAQLLIVLKHEGVHAMDYVKCLQSQTVEACSKRIGFTVEKGEPFPNLPGDYGTAFVVDEWEAYSHELNPKIKDLKDAFFHLQKSLVLHTIEHLEKKRRSSGYIKVIHEKIHEIPVVDFEMEWEGRTILASIPYFLGPNPKGALIENLLKTLRARLQDLGS